MFGTKEYKDKDYVALKNVFRNYHTINKVKFYIFHYIFS